MPGTALRALLPPSSTTTTTDADKKKRAPSAAFIASLGAPPPDAKRPKLNNTNHGLPPRMNAPPPPKARPAPAAAVAKNDKKKNTDDEQQQRKRERALIRRALEARADLRRRDAHFAERRRKEEEEAAAAALEAQRTPEERALAERAAEELYERIRAETPFPAHYARRPADRYGRPWFRRLERFAHLHHDTMDQFCFERTLVYVTCEDDHEPPTFATLKDLKRSSVGRLTEIPFACWFGADLIFRETDASTAKRVALYGADAAYRKYYDDDDTAAVGANPIPRGHFAIPRKGVFAARWPLHGANIHGYRAFTRSFNDGRDTPLTASGRAALANAPPLPPHLIPAHQRD